MAPGPKSAPTMDEIRPLLSQLDNTSLLSILTTAAETNAKVRTKIFNAAESRRAQESSRVISFDWMSGSIWREINVKHRNLSGSKQYDAAGDVHQNIESTIENIVSQCGPYSSPGTRRNGLSVLRKIGKTICLSGGSVIGHEVQILYAGETSLEEGMLSIIKCMGDEERWAIRGDVSASEALWLKLLELKGLADEYCILEGMEDVLEHLEEGFGEEDEEEED